EKHGVAVQKSEIVGLIPERAIVGAAEAALRVSDAASHILEAKIRAAAPPPPPSPPPPSSRDAAPTLNGWIDELAGAAPTPGGGSGGGEGGRGRSGEVGGRGVCRGSGGGEEGGGGDKESVYGRT